MSPDSPEPETDYQLTPRTEAKYSKIDEEFQMMLQRNQINGQRVGALGRVAAPYSYVCFESQQVGISASNYSLPVSVPVNSSYGDSSLLQSASPQMVHTSISPRPSSSETDSVYPSGGMLEMSNGYPNSASPIAGCGSPSPGPSPGLNISKSLTHTKQHSPGTRSNLRVVIPTPLGPSLTQDDVSYGEVSISS